MTYFGFVVGAMLLWIFLEPSWAGKWAAKARKAYEEAADELDRRN